MIESLKELNTSIDSTNAMTRLEKLRKQSSIWQEKYEVHGRNALKKLIAEVYGFYVAANESGCMWSKVAFEKMRKHVVDVDGKKLKASSKDAHVLVRYVFSGFTDKQVSVYGGTIAKAYGSKVRTDDFESFVDENMGFAGVVNNAKAKKAAGLTHVERLVTTGKTALRNIETQHAKFVSGAREAWQDNEQYRFYVCVREKEGWELGDVALKELWLTAAQIDEVIAMVGANIQEISSDNVEAKATDEQKMEALSAETARANALTRMENIQADMRAAHSKGNRALFLKLQEEKKDAKIEIESARIKLAEIKKKRLTANA